jgi:hypothetical protein
MKIQEKIYCLGSMSGNKMEKDDELLVAINGQRTRLIASEIFGSFKQREASIKGHSIIGEFPIVENRIEVSKDILVSFFSDKLEEEILLTRFEYPLIQNSDMEIDGDVVIEKLKELLPAEEGEIKVEIEENEINLETGLEEETKVEEEAEKLEEEEGLEGPVNCVPYEEGKVALLDKGWKEYSIDNFRLLFKEKTESEPAKAQVIYLVNSETFQDVKFSVLDKKESEKMYKLSLSSGEILILSDDKLSFESE